MQTSRKLTQFLFAALALVALAASALGQAVQNPPVLPSDQRAGSVLVFPYYNSSVDGVVDTRLTITNTDTRSNKDPNNTVAVHLFLIAGCTAADIYACLTPMAQLSLKASEWDPTNRGYLIAVAVDMNTGEPIRHNLLIGNAFVKDGDFVGNYGAEAFWKYTAAPVAAAAGVATIQFNGTEYDAAPTGFLAEIQSPLSATQRIVHASIDGDVNAPSGLNTVGASRLYRSDETMVSFVLGLSGCQPIFSINSATIRVGTTLDKFLVAGDGGTLYYDLNRGSVGLIMTANRHNQQPAQWSGIRTVHKRATSARTLSIPVFIPTC